MQVNMSIAWNIIYNILVLWFKY